MIKDGIYLKSLSGLWDVLKYSKVFFVLKKKEEFFLFLCQCPILSFPCQCPISVFQSKKQKPNFVSDGENAQSKHVWNTWPQCLALQPAAQMLSSRAALDSAGLCRDPSTGTKGLLPAQGIPYSGTCVVAAVLCRCQGCCKASESHLWAPFTSPAALCRCTCLLFLFLSQHLKCTSCSLKFAAHLWKCRLGSL